VENSRFHILLGNRPAVSAEAAIIKLGIVCCACAIVIVLAVALAAAT